MEIKKMPFEEISQFSKRDMAYQLHPEQFADFIEDIPSLESLEKKIHSRQLFDIDRNVLVSHLKEQYKSSAVSDKLKQNIDSLQKKNTFTITTAHQPSLFTGPLYYVLKILSAIRLCEILKDTYPAYNFVPCFISGGEDHDYEEINHCSVYGKEIKWNSTESGSCGRFSLKGIDTAIADLEAILGSSPNAKELTSMLKSSYDNSKNYGEFTLKLVNHLFGEMGLVSINMDSPKLKGLFKDIIKREITESFSEDLVNKQIEKLNTLGFKAQASPREINFFYLTDNRRDRIVLEDLTFKVLDTEISFTKEEILDEIDNHPERFSPNVIIRPLYQERVLPNLAYIGGGGEIAYWLERKTQFKEAGISFPILIRRNSAGIIDSKKIKLWNDLGFSPNQLALDTDHINKLFAVAENNLPISLVHGKKEAEEIYTKMAKEISDIDASIGKSVLAEAQKNRKSFDILEAKLIKFFKQKEEVNLNRIYKVQSYLFPDGSLQERKTNFMEFYLKKGKDLFTEMKKELNPLEKEFILFILD